MAFTIASNRQTQQPSLQDGSSVKCILASRAFMKLDTGTTFPVVDKVGDGDVTGWSDLGAVMKSKVGMEYTKEYNEVRSGLDGIYKTSYVTAKSCTWSFALDNYDSTVLGLLTNQTKQAISSGSHSGYKLWVGKEDTVVGQLLLIGTNKIDSKEHQYWSPEADIRFAWEEDGDAIVIRVTALLHGVQFSADTLVSGDDKKLSFYEVHIWD